MLHVQQAVRQIQVSQNAFSIISAPEISHRAMDNISEGLEADRCYVNDVLVWGWTHSESITKN